ncbi:MAG: AzlD domain-containing protein [Lachnospiraceae bacterium]|nr:AzlD domain-containing protein [Lachnospiraceae bacterium]
MSRLKITLSLIIMILTVYSVRVLPLLFLRKNITNRFVRSFFHYVPYVTLAVMTFPAIVLATQNVLSGVLALLVGLAAAWLIGDMFLVAILCCATVFVSGLFL